jgi:hypothetical protein
MRSKSKQKRGQMQRTIKHRQKKKRLTAAVQAIKAQKTGTTTSARKSA